MTFITQRKWSYGTEQGSESGQQRSSKHHRRDDRGLNYAEKFYPRSERDTPKDSTSEKGGTVKPQNRNP